MLALSEHASGTAMRCHGCGGGQGASRDPLRILHVRQQVSIFKCHERKCPCDDLAIGACDQHIAVVIPTDGVHHIVQLDLMMGSEVAAAADVHIDLPAVQS